MPHETVGLPLRLPLPPEKTALTARLRDPKMPRRSLRGSALAALIAAAEGTCAAELALGNAGGRGGWALGCGASEDEDDSADDDDADDDKDKSREDDEAAESPTGDSCVFSWSVERAACAVTVGGGAGVVITAAGGSEAARAFMREAAAGGTGSCSA